MFVDCGVCRANGDKNTRTHSILYFITFSLRTKNVPQTNSI